MICPNCKSTVIVVISSYEFGVKKSYCDKCGSQWNFSGEWDSYESPEAYEPNPHQKQIKSIDKRLDSWHVTPEFIPNNVKKIIVECNNHE